MIFLTTMKVPARRQLLRVVLSFSSGSSTSGKYWRKILFGIIFDGSALSLFPIVARFGFVFLVFYHKSCHIYNKHTLFQPFTVCDFALNNRYIHLKVQVHECLLYRRNCDYQKYNKNPGLRKQNCANPGFIRHFLISIQSGVIFEEITF